MSSKTIQGWIERAYAEYLIDSTQLSADTWSNLDDHDISPAALWCAFKAGFTPIDIYINQEIING